MPNRDTVSETHFAVKLAEGLSQRQAYKEAFGLQELDPGLDQRASNLANRQDIKEITEAARIDIQETLKEYAPDALQVIYSLVVDKDAPHNVRLQAAKDILDRAGHSSTHKVETKNVKEYHHTELSESEKEELKRLLA